MAGHGPAMAWFVMVSLGFVGSCPARSGEVWLGGARLVQAKVRCGMSR